MPADHEALLAELDELLAAAPEDVSDIEAELDAELRRLGGGSQRTRDTVRPGAAREEGR